MPLALYGHPFSSYTQKALIALYENETPFAFCCIGPDTPQHVTEWLRRWPLAKFPLLADGERSIAEASVIIEYLQIARPGPVRLIPDDPTAALDVRFLDRFFDLYVMDAMQVAVDSALGRIPMTSVEGLALAKKRLERAHMLGSKASYRGEHGPLAMRLRWRTVQPRPRCFTPIGCTRSLTSIPCCALIVRVCSHVRRSRAQLRRRGRFGPCFRSARRIGTEA